MSNRPDAAGLHHAREAGIDARAIDHRPFHGDRAGHEAEIGAALASAGIELVCLAGYMRLLTPTFVTAWRGRMLNIHPSLLPAFPGLHTHARAIATEREAARMHGPSGDPADGRGTDPCPGGDARCWRAIQKETLADRVLAQEHLIYPTALTAFVSGQAAGQPSHGAALLNPLPIAAALP